MRTVWPVCLSLVLFSLLLPGPCAAAEWRDNTHPISITPPSGWSAMGVALLADTNRSVRHITPWPYLAGFQASDGDTLIFPYVLVQYLPYSELPWHQRPVYQLDEYDTLQFLARLVRFWQADDPLPEGMDELAFSQAYDCETVRLVEINEDGSFLLGGSIPEQQGRARIEYRTLGRIGREGVAFATVFTNEGISAIGRVLPQTLSSLAFPEGMGFLALPEHKTVDAGYLPPAAEPLPLDALVAGDGAFGLVPADRFTPLRYGTFRQDDPTLVSAYPAVLSHAGVSHVLTRTPTSERITRPWVALSFAPWELAGIEANVIERGLTVAQWGMVFKKLVGVDERVAMQQARRLLQNPDATVRMMGRSHGGASSAWLIDQINLSQGRVTFSRRVMADENDTLQTRVTVTLVAGIKGIAILVSETYADASADGHAVLSEMHNSLRFAGGSRYVDVPPASGESESADQDTVVSTGNVREDDPVSPPTQAGEVGSPVVSETPSVGGGDSAVIGLVFGGFAVIVVGLAVAVILIATSRAKPSRRRGSTSARPHRRR